MDKINVADREAIIATANSLRWDLGEDYHDTLMESIYEDAVKISSKTVKKEDAKKVCSVLKGVNPRVIKVK